MSDVARGCASCLHRDKPMFETPCMYCNGFNKWDPSLPPVAGPIVTALDPGHATLREAVRQALDILQEPHPLGIFPDIPKAIALLQAAADLDSLPPPKQRALRAVAWLRKRTPIGTERMERLDDIEAALK